MLENAEVGGTVMRISSVLAGLFVASLLLTPLPDAFAKSKKSGAGIADCEAKHDACNNYCAKAKKTVAEMNECSRGCDIELGRCEKNIKLTVPGNILNRQDKNKSGTGNSQ
jgi:hypothetical protein